MQHIIRETITLIRIERWLISDDSPDTMELASERIVEEIVLSSTETTQVGAIIQQLLAQHHTEDSQEA